MIFMRNEFKNLHFVFFCMYFSEHLDLLNKLAVIHLRFKINIYSVMEKNLPSE